MKKVLTILFLGMLMPLMVSASSPDANAAGGQVISSGGGGGGSSAANRCVYYLGYTQADYQYYGIRVTFYLEDGTQAPSIANPKKSSKTIDVWSWSRLNPSSADKFEYSVNAYFDKRYITSGKTKYGAKYMSRIDYINGGEFKVISGQYDFYYDKAAKKFNKDKGNPLSYLMYKDRSYFKEYFTTPEVVSRYAALADADIDVSHGTYFMVIEPVLLLSRMSCNTSSYGGRYTPTELGKLYAAGLINFQNATLRNTTYFDSLRLEKEATFGKWTFKFAENFNRDNSSANLKASYLTGTYGYGISLISGKDVCKEDCGGKPFKIIYRVIDLANPFLGLNGRKRTLSSDSNWYEKESTIDARIYEKKPIYTVTLKPSVIKKIREDNKKVNYAKILASYSAGAKFKDSKFKKKFGL